MAFNFNPSFNPSVRRTLKKREDLVLKRDPNWVYKKYAYIILESKAGKNIDNILDSDSIFSVLPTGYFSGRNSIGTNYSTSILSTFSREDGIRKNRPYITSAKITSNYGSDIYESTILTADVSFQVSTLADFEKVNQEFFVIGAKMKLSYGWLNGASYLEDSNTNDINTVQNTKEFHILNYGFTMGDKGVFNCNVRGMTSNGLIGQQSIDRSTKVPFPDIFGVFSITPADIPSAIKSLAYSAFDLETRNTSEASTSKKIQELRFDGDLIVSTNEQEFVLRFNESLDSSLNLLRIPFYASKFTVSTLDTNSSVRVEPNSSNFFYMKFVDLISFIQNIYNKKPSEYTFSFSTKLEEYKISPNIPQLGSADPRRYILPGELAKYSPDETVRAGLSVEQARQLSEFSDNNVGAVLADEEVIIQNILISVDLIEQFFNQINNKRVNEKLTPKTTIEFIRLLSNDINFYTGGLVDIQVAPDSENDSNINFEDKFIIFNNTQVQKIVPPKPTTNNAYIFNTEAENNITRDVSLESDFDAETALIYSVGRVKSGDIKIRPLINFYPRLGSKLGNLTVDENIKTDIYNLVNKFTIIKNGINNRKASTIAKAMRKLLVLAEDIQIDSDIKELRETVKVKNTDSTFATIPFYLKLSLTLDGIDGLGVLQPISIDRLPSDYKRAGVSFFIQGIDHSFDGQGGWTTTITAPMRLGNVQKPKQKPEDSKIVLSTELTPEVEEEKTVEPFVPDGTVSQQGIYEFNRGGAFKI